MQDKILTMQELPLTERPYEKMAMYGRRALTEAELLAVIICSGYQGNSALGIANKMLATYPQLKDLSNLTLEELLAFRGIGKAKALRIQAAFELGRRSAHQQRCQVNPTIESTNDVLNLLGEKLDNLDQETLYVLLLDCKLKLIRPVQLSLGGLNQAAIHPRDVFREAIRANAAGIILVHNHPSGDPTPSSSDVQSTRELLEIGERVGISLLDHVIVGQNQAISLKARGDI